MRALAILALCAACTDAPDGPVLASVTPDHGPLVGGTTIVVHGAGFARNAPVRVLVAGREAPLAHAIDATSIEVVIPPGERTGDAEIAVIAGARTATAAHLFRYSAPPVLDRVTPAEVDFDSGTTTLTVTGRGFLDDASGELAVLVDGTAATDVHVIDDATLSFTAPLGTAFVRPDLHVVDLRGAGEKRAAFRYRPGPRPGLLMFARFGAVFATFYEPARGTSFAIPRTSSSNASFTTVVRDETGELWGFDRSQRWGRIDMRTQTLSSAVQTSLLFPALVRVGSVYFGIERFSHQFGRFDPATAAFAPIASIPCCGPLGLASDGVTIWLLARIAGVLSISTVDPASGALGPPVALVTPGPVHVEELRWFEGALYGTTAGQTLLAIDPATGGTTVQPVSPGRANSMEVAW